MINVALGELGNHEGDKSHNKYEAFTGMDDSQPWCAAFVTWVAGAAGYLKEGMFPRYVGCTTGLRLFKTKTNADVHYANTGYTPQPGDIIFFSWKMLIMFIQLKEILNVKVKLKLNVLEQMEFLKRRDLEIKQYLLMLLQSMLRR